MDDEGDRRLDEGRREEVELELDFRSFQRSSIAACERGFLSARIQVHQVL